MQVKRCPEMEIFCKGDSITQRLEKVLMSDHRPCWENDLNTTIQKMFMETHPKEEDSKEEILDEENAEEWNSKEQHPKVEDSVEDTKEEDSERGESGSLEQRSS
ncbi:hypothetical protein PVL29_018173 [Vitis rotundifolia]|nr:hypothetical protein PVL29_018173 [Vitis rotundifolia]